MSIFAPLIHGARVLHGQLREQAKRGSKLAQIVTGEPPRSDKWPKVEHAHLALHPICAACGGALRLNVHHMKPFHLDPALELDPTNLITLCMGEFECHIRIGHGDDFKAYNPGVQLDAAAVLKNPGQRSEIEAKAKAARLYELQK
jgi:5-methylcytosine-specific restriction enzyme A